MGRWVTWGSWMMAIALQACAAQTPAVHVGRYESIPWGFSTNTWWVEGPTGVVLMDTQFLPSAAVDAVEVAEAYTGKKVVLAFVLHANPDKFNGVGVLAERGIRVVTSEQVRNRIPEVDALRRTWFYDRYKPDYPEKLVLPESLGDQSTTINAAGLSFRVVVTGPSVSRDHIVVQVGDHVFAGDILANKHHAWLELGLVPEWLRTLDEIGHMNPRHLYPGRGHAQGPQLLETQRAYLHDFENAVRRAQGQQPWSDEVKKQIVTEIETKYPGYGNPFFINRGVKSVWDRGELDGVEKR
ncbi:MAG: MBL fold metallo-hydrolase [Myxococcales bacterium]|nr:MBL fold metallo-hydrolase [Myxococcales bacterium]